MYLKREQKSIRVAEKHKLKEYKDGVVDGIGRACGGREVCLK